MLEITPNHQGVKQAMKKKMPLINKLHTWAKTCFPSYNPKRLVDVKAALVLYVEKTLLEAMPEPSTDVKYFAGHTEVRHWGRTTMSQVKETLAPFIGNNIVNIKEF